MDTAWERLEGYGFDGLAEATSIVLTEAMKEERYHSLQAAAPKRTAERRGDASGFKDKTIKSRRGELKLQVPEVRAGDFYPTVP